MAERNLYSLDDLSGYKVADGYPDVRGWKVKDTQGNTVGKVDNLLVNKSSERVVYLDVEVDESLLSKDHEALSTPANKGVHEFINKDGENHLIIPIGLVDLDEDNKQVYSNQIQPDTFRKTKRFRKGSTVDPDYELIVFQGYRPDSGIDSNTSINDEFYNRQEFQSRNRRS